MDKVMCAHPDWYDPDVPNVCPWCALHRVRAQVEAWAKLPADYPKYADGLHYAVGILRAALDGPYE